MHGSGTQYLFFALCSVCGWDLGCLGGTHFGRYQSYQVGPIYLFVIQVRILGMQNQKYVKFTVGKSTLDKKKYFLYFFSLIETFFLQSTTIPPSLIHPVVATTKSFVPARKTMSPSLQRTTRSQHSQYRNWTTCVGFVFKFDDTQVTNRTKRRHRFEAKTRIWFLTFFCKYD